MPRPRARPLLCFPTAFGAGGSSGFGEGIPWVLNSPLYCCPHEALCMEKYLSYFIKSLHNEQKNFKWVFEKNGQRGFSEE